MPTLQQLGEKKVLQLLRQKIDDTLGSLPGLVCGPGDDAAVIDVQSTKMVCTTDALLEGVHFDWRFIEPFLLGRKSLAVNLSDLAAMGARPKWVLLSIAIPADESFSHLEAFYDGFLDLAKIHSIGLIGGDLDLISCARSEAPSWSRKASLVSQGWKISVTLLGEVQRPVYRCFAKVGDQIWVTGVLGASRLGFEILKSHPEEIKTGKKKLFVDFLERWKITADRSSISSENPDQNPNLRPNLSSNSNPNLNSNLNCDSSLVMDSDPFIHAHLCPTPRLREGLCLGQNRLANSMIDLSDGLTSDLSSLCEASNVGARVFVDRIPLLPHFMTLATRFGFDALPLALQGGEDYELLFTIDPAKEIEFKQAFSLLGTPIHCIGEVVLREAGIQYIGPREMCNHDKL